MQGAATPNGTVSATSLRLYKRVYVICAAVIGKLLGGSAREDFTFLDPRADNKKIMRIRKRFSLVRYEPVAAGKES